MQIWKLSNNKWRHNDFITKSWMAKLEPSRNQTNYISFEKYWWELSKTVLFIEFEPLCQKLWAFLTNFGIFTMSTHQIWSCHVTEEASFEIFLFCPNSTFNIRKSHKISSGKAIYFKSYQAKISPREWKAPPPSPPPPSAFRVKGELQRQNKLTSSE